MSGLLITGGGSYLGQHLVPLALAEHETHYSYYHTDPFELPAGRQLDIRDATAVARLVSALQPSTIIHTVGSNRSPAMAEVIVEGTRNITRAAADSGAQLVHISTDVLFDGREAPYDEDAQPAPLHEYGRAKASAETIVSGWENHVIIRTSLIYGLDVMDRGTEWIVNALQAGQPVTLFTDQQRNPVWAVTLSQACLELAELSYCGVLNVAGSQVLSRAEFALRMLDWWGVEDRTTLMLGRSDPDRWPADCTLSLDRAKSLLQTPLPGVDDVLQRGRNFKQAGVDVFLP